MNHVVAVYRQTTEHPSGSSLVELCYEIRNEDGIFVMARDQLAALLADLMEIGPVQRVEIVAGGPLTVTHRGVADIAQANRLERTLARYCTLANSPGRLLATGFRSPERAQAPASTSLEDW